MEAIKLGSSLLYDPPGCHEGHIQSWRHDVDFDNDNEENDVHYAEEVKSLTPVRFANFQFYTRKCINRDFLRKLRMVDVLLFYIEQIVSILCNFVLKYKFTPAVLWKLYTVYYMIFYTNVICDFYDKFHGCYNQYLGCNKSIIQSCAFSSSVFIIRIRFNPTELYKWDHSLTQTYFLFLRSHILLQHVVKWDSL